MLSHCYHFLLARLEVTPSLQHSDVRLIVEIPGGSKEELVVNGKMLSGELLLKLKTMFNVDSLTVVTFPDAEPTQERVEGAKYVDPADQYFAEPSLTNVLQYFRSMWDVREDYYERSKLTNCNTSISFAALLMCVDTSNFTLHFFSAHCSSTAASSTTS